MLAVAGSLSTQPARSTTPFSDAFELFVEAKWSRIHTRGNNAGPSFIQGTLGQFDVRERVRLDNPFLNPADRTQIANAILASGCNTSYRSALQRVQPSAVGIGGPLNAADIAAINAGRTVSSRAQLARRRHSRRGFRRVDLPRRRRLPVARSTTTGATKSRPTTASSIRRTRPSASSIASASCWRWTPAVTRPPVRSSAGLSSTRRRQRHDSRRQNANLAADIAACVPYDPFGSGATTQLP